MKAVIFDMDGVMIDSEPLHTRLLLHTFAKYEIPFDTRDFDLYVGTTTPSLFKQLIAKNHLSVTLDELTSYQSELTRAAIENGEVELIDGIRELLQTLKSCNIPTAIASSSSMDLITTVVKKFELTDYFSHYTSGEDLPRSKPDPAIYLLTAQKLSVDPVDCLVIEDARLGVQAAKAAGMTCIGFQNPNSGNQDLAKADKIVDSIRDVVVL